MTPVHPVHELRQKTGDKEKKAKKGKKCQGDHSKCGANYRCCIPALAGFVSPHSMGPGPSIKPQGCQPGKRKTEPWSPNDPKRFRDSWIDDGFYADHTAPMPSFDIVSRVELIEVKNAVNQASKEVSTRYDFKGSDARIDLEGEVIKLSAKDEHRLQGLVEVVVSKLAKRGVSLKNVDQSKSEISPLGHARQTISFQQGIPGNHAKDISAKVRSTQLKVTAAIQGDIIRVTGKSRDDLQKIISFLKTEDFPLELAFENFRN